MIHVQEIIERLIAEYDTNTQYLYPKNEKQVTFYKNRNEVLLREIERYKKLHPEYFI